MIEEAEPQFDAPIPGESLTVGQGGNNYKRPPKHSTIEQALAVYMETMQDDSFADNIIMALEMGIPVTTIANMMQIKGVIDGLHTIDVSMLILPILMEMIAYIAESRNVDYDMGTDESKDIPSEEAILASINRSKMKAPETVQEQVPEEVTMEEDPSVGLMARSI